MYLPSKKHNSLTKYQQIHSIKDNHSPMINRINKYLSEVESPQAPPIIKHKDNVSQLTIYNTGWSEGYAAGYQDSKTDISMQTTYVLVFFLVVGFSIGLSIGIWL